MSDEVDFEVSVTDVTLLETDGDYEETDLLMTEDFEHEWALKTMMTIDSVFGLASFELMLYRTRDVLIRQYQPSVGNVLYNPDLQVLNEWCSQRGWQRPTPSERLVREDIEFWVHFWKAELIDSELLESMYGERDQIEWEGF